MRNVVVEKSIELALLIIDYCELLDHDRKYVVARQLLKSGTSIGANIHEVQNAESKRDFIHKFKISAKEADELEYWLKLCQASEHYPSPDEKLLKDLQSVILVISKIISSSKKS